MKKGTEKKKLEQVIISISSSLLSHLWGTYHKTPEGIRFHKKCCRQYLKDFNDSLDIFLK